MIWSAVSFIYLLHPCPLSDFLFKTLGCRIEGDRRKAHQRKVTPKKLTRLIQGFEERLTQEYEPHTANSETELRNNLASFLMFGVWALTFTTYKAVSFPSNPHF